MKHTIAIISLVLLSVSTAQANFTFPPIVPEAGSISTYASHEDPNYRNFADVSSDSIHARIGQSVGLLELTYRTNTKQELTYLCTASIISEEFLITNAHCAYSPQVSKRNGNIRLIAASLRMEVNRPGDQGNVYPVKVEPVEINSYLDFAILEFLSVSPYQRYGVVNFTNHRSANVGEPLFMIHHSNIAGTHHKRITEEGCTRLHPSRIEQYKDRMVEMAYAPGENRGRPLADYDIPHFCDSENGSSGSLVYARSDGAVVGLHFAGLNSTNESERFNLFIDIEVICRESRILRQDRFCTKVTPVEEVPSVSNDITTSKELVAQVARGGVIHLAATTFYLTSPLELAGNVQLLGKGYQKTRIVSNVPGHIVRYNGGGEFQVQGVSFERTGNNEGDVLQITGGTINIRDCMFTGGKSPSGSTSSLGNGISITGLTQGIIHNNRSKNNNASGIRLQGVNSEVQIIGNELQQNGEGIFYWNSTGYASNNSLMYNLFGIVASGQSSPVIVGNIIDGNDTGIVYTGTARGTISDNTISNNRGAGVWIQDVATPLLSKNTIVNNPEDIKRGR